MLELTLTQPFLFLKVSDRLIQRIKNNTSRIEFIGGIGTRQDYIKVQLKSLPLERLGLKLDAMSHSTLEMTCLDLTGGMTYPVPPRSELIERILKYVELEN